MVRVPLALHERVEVGTVYKSNPFEARRLGARFIAANAARHLETHFADKEKLSIGIELIAVLIESAVYVVGCPSS